ncbi:MAG: YbjN domain-containing protein [Clostridiales bacterium]|nr:YbjN domain-containing protein [Clostridiales bacterium]
MADKEPDIKLAKRNFKNLCAMLDDNHWKYETDEERLQIDCSARGDDLPINIRIKLNTELEIVTLYSPMPFTVNAESRNAMLIAVARANYGMIDGSFDYNIKNGKIIFRMTSSYAGTILDKDVFEYMLFTSCHTVDDYNDKFETVNKIKMSAEQIIRFIK